MGGEKETLDAIAGHAYGSTYEECTHSQQGAVEMEYAFPGTMFDVPKEIRPLGSAFECDILELKNLRRPHLISVPTIGEPMTKLGKWDRIIEDYEKPVLLKRMLDILDEKGVLTIEDYLEALAWARNDAHTEGPYSEVEPK